MEVNYVTTLELPLEFVSKWKKYVWILNIRKYKCIKPFLLLKKAKYSIAYLHML